MAESDVLTGFGTTLWLKVGAGPLTEVGEMIEIEPGGVEWSTYSRMHFTSPGRMNEYGKSIAEPGTGSFQINWMPGNNTDDLITAAVNQIEPCEFELRLPGDVANPAQKESGSVLVLSRTPSVPLDDRMTCEVSLQFTGTRTMAAL